MEATTPRRRKKKGTSPTQKSLKVLRDAGWKADVAEKFIRLPNHPAGGFRRDLFNVADIVAVKKGEPVLFVQTTDSTSVAHHLEKLRDEEHAATVEVLVAVGRVEIHGWAKPTKTIRRWRQRILEIGPEDVVVERKVSRMAVKTPVQREQRDLFVLKEAGGV